MIFKIVLLSLLAVTAHAQIIGQGPCPNIKVVQNFNVSAYLGQWYQIQRYPNPFEKGDCSTARYGPVENGLVKVHNVEIRNGSESFVDGTAELANPNSTEAKLIVKFFNPDTIADYWVVGTDYNNYSFVWTCQSEVGFNIQFAWVLGRTKPLTEEANAAVNALIKSSGIDASYFQVHDLPQCIKAP